MGTHGKGVPRVAGHALPHNDEEARNAFVVVMTVGNKIVNEAARHMPKQNLLAAHRASFMEAAQAAEVFCNPALADLLHTYRSVVRRGGDPVPAQEAFAAGCRQALGTD